MIYATVGTMFLDFSRLIRKMDDIAGQTGERVVIQIGDSPICPVHAEYFSFKPREDVLALQREARVIVCHAGIGAVQDALMAGQPFIVVPRLKRFHEHINDHQLDLAEAVQRRGWGRMILDVNDLDDVCANPPAAPAGYRAERESLVASIRESLMTLVRRER